MPGKPSKAIHAEDLVRRSSSAKDLVVKRERIIGNYGWHYLSLNLALKDCAVGKVTVRDAIEAAPIAPLSLEASAVGAVGTTTFPNLMALTTLVVVAYGSERLTPVILMLLFVVVRQLLM
jgi:hypothetical protein